MKKGQYSAKVCQNQGIASIVPRRIAVIRALQLGDLLVAVPALRALRRRFPHAEITLVGLPWAESFVSRYRAYIDRFVEFVGYPGLPEVEMNEEGTQRFLADQQAYGYDLVIQMHGSGGSSNPLALAFQAAVTVGFYEKEMLPGMTLGAPYPQDRPEILRNLALVELLGCVDLDPQLEFPLFEHDYRELSTLLDRAAGRLSIGIHPGSRPPARRWPAEYFACLADTLIERFGAEIIFTGGPDELQTVEDVLSSMRLYESAINLVGKTSLGALGALISQLDLFISNDTGPAHIASAFPNPSIILFGPADFQRWAPLKRDLHVTVRHPVSCSPCGFWSCPIDHRCLRGIAPSRVLALAEQHLRAALLKQNQQPVGL